MTIIPLIIFVLVMVGTPGPANLLLMSGGSNFGFRRCLPFILGLILGKLILNIGIGFGLGALVAENNFLQNILKFMSAVFMIFLATKTWNTIDAKNTNKKVFLFREGLLVHPLSPKTWVMLILAWTEYSNDYEEFLTQLLILIIVFFVIQTVFHVLYCLIGQSLQSTFSNNTYLQKIMTILTIAAVLFALLV